MLILLTQVFYLLENDRRSVETPFFILYSQKASNNTMNAIQMSSGLRRDLPVLAHFPLSSFKNCSDQILPAFSSTLTLVRTIIISWSIHWTVF